MRYGCLVLMFLSVLVGMAGSGQAGERLNPGDTYQEECNTCTVMSDGRSVHCTLLACDAVGSTGALQVSMCGDQLERIIREIEPYISHRIGNKKVEYGAIMSERQWQQFQQTRKECAP